MEQLSDSGIEHGFDCPFTPTQHEDQPLFQKAPPPITDSNALGGGAVGNITDWSRSARNKRKLMHMGDHDDQTFITDYYSILDNIQHLINENKKLSLILHNLIQENSESENSKELEFTPVLKHIILNAERNAVQMPKCRRHPEILKKFCTALFIYAGPLAYEFMQQNMPQALPCLRTVQHIVHSEYKPISEGDFRFDDLLQHIKQYNAPMIISVGEDATRVIARVEYDSETDRCVGFVLPLTENSLPIIDSFTAVSFNAIEKMFSDNQIAKYAYVYMAQPLGKSIPVFCLACVGTDNKFTHETVLNRYNYIFEQCKRRGIHVVSFGGDGDSRLMKAMRIASGLITPKEGKNPAVDLSFILKAPKIPSSWFTWYRIRQPSTLAYVQDVVHVAVKLKCRLLKPSVVLPMGDYVAGSHHIKFVQFTYGKDQHGLRERDVDHKDKQNYDACLHIMRASQYLDTIPDAVGTKCYIELMQCVIESYLDKSVDPLTHIEKIWYAAFFLRYWRQWIVLSPQYTLKNNFVTNNAYMCVELNAHALISFVMTIRDNFNDDNFLPWWLGSQSCEKAFRAARSMTSTFSTVINFGMLGLLRRLHRLQIQANLQAESIETGIIFP